MGLIDVPRIIGMPPGSNTSRDNPMYNSLPQAVILPCEPHLNLSSAVFTVNDATTKFKKLVNALGFNYNNPHGVEVAFLADNFPSDSFSNEYGDSFLENINMVGSGGLGQLAQMSGAGNSIKMAEKVFSNFSNFASKKGHDVMSGVFGQGADVSKNINNTLNDMAQEGGFLANIAKGASATLAGGRLDFPSVWKGSSFTPSYTMTVRLFNPNPASYQSTKKYIIGPLAVLLTLGIPRVFEQGSTNDFLYNWPFFAKISCPGIYYLNPCCVTNITVIKGGDQQSISWNQRLNIVDVRMEFSSLFGTMINGEAFQGSEPRPTLKNYLDALGGEKQLKKIPRESEDVDNSVIPPSQQTETAPSATSTTTTTTEPPLSTRIPPNSDIITGQLNQNVNQVASFKSFASGVVKAAKDAVRSPASTISSAVNKVKEYVAIFDDATRIVGNVKSFDKENIISSIYNVEESIYQFEQKVDYPAQIEKAKFILGESEKLKKATQDIEPEILNI